MKNIYVISSPIINLYKKPSKRTEITSQIIYGESFQILKKTSKWLKIKILEDGYKGFIQKKNYINYIKPTYKIKKLKSSIFNFANPKIKKGELSFGSKIKITGKKAKFLKFNKG